VTFGNSRHDTGINRISVIRPTDRSTRASAGRAITVVIWEPVSGFEPLACRLQEVRPRAPCVLAAQMPRVIALTALAALGLFCASSHEPFHAHGGQGSMVVTERSGRSRRNGAAICHGPTGQSIRTSRSGRFDQDIRSGRCTAESGRTWIKGLHCAPPRPGVSAGSALGGPPVHAGPQPRRSDQITTGHGKL